MSRFEIVVFGATVAALTISTGCSDFDRSPHDAVTSQANPLAVGSAPPLAVPTAAPTGVPFAVPPVAAPVPQAAGAAQLGLRDPNELATLRSIALGVASTAGVSSPATMSVVAASDHQSAEYLLSGAIINDHAPVYVVKMTGGPFTATHHPSKQAAPQGRVLTVVIDAATHRITDVGYVNEEPDLSKIGSLSVNLSAP